MSLKQKTISNIKWSFIESVSLKAVSFVLGIILARLLLPEDFGLLAVVNVFYLLVTLFVDGGLREALIQKKDATEIHYSTVFWMNLAMGVVLYLLLFIAAPFIEAFYHYKNLGFYIRVQSLTLIIESFGIVQIAKATKELNLKKITKARIPASLVSFGVGIYMAYHGFGIMSLIVQQLVNSGVYGILLMLSVQYKPQWIFSKQEAKTLYSFGMKILGMSLISRFYVQSLNLIFAKFYTPRSLGLNNKANTLQTAPIEIINSTLMRGIYPSLVILQDNNAKLKELFMTNINILNYIMLLLNGVFFFKAEEIILLLLGENWIGSAVYLKIIAVGSLFFPITTQAQNIFKIKNVLSSFLKFELINKAVLLLFILLLVRYFSFPTILSFVVLINTIVAFGYLFWVSRILQFSYLKECRTILVKTLTLALLGWGINEFVNYFLAQSFLFSRTISFIIMYFLLSFILITCFDKALILQFKKIISKAK